MIRDLVQLPMRKVSGELSTILPRFTSLYGMEDFHYLGREINLTDISSNFFKYKSIEYIGTNAIERVFLSKELIDLSKKWWTTNIQIYPILYKTYLYPAHLNPIAPVYRYLNGSMEILGLTGHDACQQTYYNKLIHDLESDRSHIGVSTAQRAVLAMLTPGDDAGTIDLEHNVITGNYPPRFPTLPTDTTGLRFMYDGMTTQLLNSSLSSQCGSGIYHALVDMSLVPFEIDDTVLTYEDNETARWALHTLIQTIERLIYTDIRINLVYVSQHKVHADTEFYSKYIGLTPHVSEDAAELKQTVVEQLRKWACISTLTIPTTVELIKTWSEEIFISVRVGSIVQKYYFDLASYSLVNLSFVDIFH